MPSRWWPVWLESVRYRVPQWWAGGAPEGLAGADQPCLLAICQGDMGGARTLQKKWTTFLKAQLVCSAPEWKVYFNQLRAVHTLLGTSWHNTTFFGVFQARW